MTTLLAADIGGTHSRFALFHAGGEGSLRKGDSLWLRTGEAPSFAALLETLEGTVLKGAAGGADMAVIAAAGPVREGGTACTPPNIAWDIDLSRPGEGGRFRRAFIVNDFVAQAFATRTPLADGARPVLPGEAAPDGAVAVVGAGTGLGHAALVPACPGRWAAAPSEKGHAVFPMVTPQEWEYARFLCRRLGEAYPRGDTVVSGSGLARLHLFLTGQELSPEEVTERIEEHGETLEWMARFLGRACRDYALTVLARGGLFVAGGLAARTPALVFHGAFGEEFRSSPTMGGLLARIPVALFTDQESGLWGAARCGLQALAEKGP